MSSPSAAGALAALTPDWWLSRRWYAGKTRTLVHMDPFDEAQLSPDPPVWLVLLRLTYRDGPPDIYALPLLLPASGGATDALEDPECQRLLLRLLAENALRAPIRFESYRTVMPAEPRTLGVEQSNTSVAYGHDWILKNIRRVVFGANRDLEVGRFLCEQAHFAHTPEVAGAITYHGKGFATLGVLQAFVENQGDCWDFFRAHLQPAPNAPDDVYWAQDGLPDQHERLIEDAERLGQVTGEMHAALGSRADLPDFAPEPLGEADREAWLADIEYQLAGASARFGKRVERYREQLRRLAAGLMLEGVAKIQIHGDYHLGNVLKTANGYTVIDFEGEPARPLEERRAKQPALRDVAGMLRSLDYVAHSSNLPESYAVEWSHAAGERFVAGWQQTAGSQSLHGDQCRRLVTFFAVAKALYELNYELNNRPAWVDVPLAGIDRLLLGAQP